MQNKYKIIRKSIHYLNKDRTIECDGDENGGWGYFDTNPTNVTCEACLKSMSQHNLEPNSYMAHKGIEDKYWVSPDELSGQPPKHETLSIEHEQGLSVYKGKEFKFIDAPGAQTDDEKYRDDPTMGYDSVNHKWYRLGERLAY